MAEEREERAPVSFDGPPEYVASRNINTDVHIGHAPQRPYARQEDLAQDQGWASAEDIQASGADIRKSRDGTWVRVVRRHTGQSVIRNGSLHHQVALEERPVAFTLQAARASGGRADYWDGSTWIRGGLKREAEAPENLGNDFATLGTELEYEEAPAQDQAIARAEAARSAVLGTPVAAAPEEDRPSRAQRARKED